MTMTYADKEWNVIKAKSECGKLELTLQNGSEYCIISGSGKQWYEEARWNEERKDCRIGGTKDDD